MITAARMAAIDRNAAALGVTRRQLMESSGNAVARAVRDVADAGDDVAIIAGRGNNGGDGMVAARFLDEFDVSVTLVGHPDRLGPLPAANWAVLDRSIGPLDVAEHPGEVAVPTQAVVVDALLGTGVDGPLREPVTSAVEAINDAPGHVVAVDVPTGEDPDATTPADLAVEADTVVTFHDRKPIHDVLESTVRTEPIGIPDAAALFVGPGDAARVAGRDPDAHKGDHGRVLVVGGGPYTGAPALSARAALRAGADLAEVAVPAAAAETVASFGEDLIVHALPGDRLEPSHVERVTELAARADTLAIGPGLGSDGDTIDAVETILTGYEGRAVVDADALPALRSANPEATVVATPHRGEFADLGYGVAGGWRDVVDAAESAARDLGVALLVKGPYDVITDGSSVRVNRTGNPGMTVGGTGDVLTGAAAALLVRADPVLAGGVAAWATGRAGDRCRDEGGYGFLASDVCERLPPALSRLEEGPI